MAEYIEKWDVVNRLIDLENEFQHYKPFRGFEHAMYRKLCEVEISIGKTEAADVVPVVHGRWIHSKTYYELDECNCSLCGQLVTTAIDKRMNYCPQCGTRMDGE